MDIFYTVDDNFVPQLAANICSVCENHPQAGDLVFHIFSKGISKSNQENLNEFVVGYGQGIAFYDISGFMDKLGFEFDTAGWNEIVLARLFMAEFLPKELDRVIYLDADTLVLGDIADMWNQDLGEKTIGMVCEPTADRARRANLGISGHNYHNAGVLLVDLSKWRSRSYQKQILSFCQENSGKLFANDQDALNVVLKDDIQTLSPRFDYSNVFDYYSYKFLNKLMPGFATQEDFDASKKHPVVVHFLGEDRPWREGNTHRFNADYHRYLKKTPWVNARNEGGWGAYYIAWRVFNGVTKPFPQVRYGIINSLIPVFMKYRALKRKSA